MFHYFAPCPVVRGSSGIANGKRWCQLWADIPDSVQFMEATLVYDTQEDGYSLRNFLTKTVDIAPTLMFIRTKKGATFGAFIPEPWVTSDKPFPPSVTKYWGDYKTFVFTLTPEYKKYAWTGLDQAPTTDKQKDALLKERSGDGQTASDTATEQKEDAADVWRKAADTAGNIPVNLTEHKYFMSANYDHLAIGGGGPRGHAIQLDNSLHYGSSEQTHLFNNPPLHNTKLSDIQKQQQQPEQQQQQPEHISKDNTPSSGEGDPPNKEQTEEGNAGCHSQPSPENSATEVADSTGKLEPKDDGNCNETTSADTDGEAVAEGPSLKDFDFECVALEVWAFAADDVHL